MQRQALELLLHFSSHSCNSMYFSRLLSECPNLKYLFILFFSAALPQVRVSGAFAMTNDLLFLRWEGNTFSRAVPPAALDGRLCDSVCFGLSRSSSTRPPSLGFYVCVSFWRLVMFWNQCRTCFYVLIFVETTYIRGWALSNCLSLRTLWLRRVLFKVANPAGVSINSRFSLPIP